ncbi:MAG: hypothetical protein Q7I98_07355 [Erysipelotrichaceae bacterium]|nr:hypothetical protein [Erysipelotrichaceae bacterium]
MRKMDNWLKAYKNYIISHESPPIYHFWVATQMISTVLRRNVWINRGAYTVYPNQYIILVAKSGSCRKSVAMEIGLDLINEIKGVHVLHERMTVEGLMDRMQRVLVLPNGRVIPDGSLLIHADELSNLFGKASYISDLMSFLTAAYTSKAKLDFLTRSRGLGSVRNPCITFLAGTTPDSMSEIFPSLTLASGLIGRILLIVGERGKKVSKPMLDESIRPDLIHDLIEISNLYGEMIITDETEKTFDEWYKKFPENPPSELRTYYERKHDHVWKASIIMSISESDKMIITRDHLLSAIQAVELVESRMGEVLSYIGATVQSSVADYIYSFIKTKHPEPLSHSVLLRKVYRRIQSTSEFRDIIDTLVDSEKIVQAASRHGIYYSLKMKREK